MRPCKIILDFSDEISQQLQFITTTLSSGPRGYGDPAAPVVDEPLDLLGHFDDGEIEGVDPAHDQCAVLDGHGSHCRHQDKRDAAVAYQCQKRSAGSVVEIVGQEVRVVKTAEHGGDEENQPRRNHDHAPVHVNDGKRDQHQRKRCLDDEAQHGPPGDGTQRQSCDRVDGCVESQKFHEGGFHVIKYKHLVAAVAEPAVRPLYSCDGKFGFFDLARMNMVLYLNLILNAAK